MNDIQIKTQIFTEHTDVQELAEFTCEFWKINRPEINPSVDRIANWIRKLKFDIAPLIVQAYRSKKLVGWLLLFVDDSKRLKINPWALGGHPHISPLELDKMKIVDLLLKECIKYAMDHTHTRLELEFEKKSSSEEYVVNPSIYSEYSLLKDDEIIFMTKDLGTEPARPKVIFPEDLEVVPLKSVAEEDLYSCYCDTFNNSEDRYTLSHTEAEKQAFFRTSFDKNEDMIDEGSVVLVDGRKPIGFILIRPTHGEGNGHVYQFGVMPEYRGRKLGPQLFDHAINMLTKLGYTRMSLAVDCDNTVALNLYTNARFIQQWRRITHVWKKPIK